MLRLLILPLLHYKYLLIQLTQREIKARYKQSIIGYTWVIVNPFLQLLVYSFVFSLVFRFPSGNIPYSVFLFIGLLPWIYLQSSISAGTLTLVDNSDLLRKVYFPREVFIYSIITAKAVDLVFASIILIGFLLYYQIPISPTVIFVVPLLLIQVILMTGLSLFLSMFNLFYRDIQYLVNLVLMLWMYLSPVVYPLSLVPDQYKALYLLNPMVGLLEGYRALIFGSPINLISLIYSFGVSLIVFIVSFYIFKKNEKIFSDFV